MACKDCEDEHNSSILEIRLKAATESLHHARVHCERKNEMFSFEDAKSFYDYIMNLVNEEVD